jgi:DivIVA domain-containing protein
VRKRKRNDDAEDMFADATPPVARITPEDIQGKEFGVARMGGYRHHEVDEFLDDLTRAMGELIEENERLRRSTPPAAAAAGADLQPFLERERDFLRALGELVQGHMEEVRTMARGAGRGATQPSSIADAPDARQDAAAPMAEPQPVTPPEPAVAAAPEPADGGPDAAPPTEPINVVETEPAAASRDEGGLRELFWGEDD